MSACRKSRIMHFFFFFPDLVLALRKMLAVLDQIIEATKKYAEELELETIINA